MKNKIILFKPNVVVIERKILEDSELSIKAKILYSSIMCLSLEFNDISNSEITKLIPEISESEIEELLQELREAGYINFETNKEIYF